MEKDPKTENCLSIKHIFRQIEATRMAKPRQLKRKKLSRRIAKLFKGGWHQQLGVFFANFLILVLLSMDTIYTVEENYPFLIAVASISGLIEIWAFLKFISNPKKFWMAVLVGEVLGEIVGTYLGHRLG